MEILKRREAKAKGLKTYFNGKPCPHGHLSEKYTCDGKCLRCCQIRYEKSSPVPYNKRRNSILKTKFGISLDQYNDMLKKQNNRCMVCNQLETRRSNKGGIRFLAVDHCHTTGKVRGLLCGNCNVALGLLNEDRDRIQKLIEYIS
tara:strand:- start:338 stop:772 length:435 start_codon:yes stop_codon:yes gene_type:complete